jgi:hypothetical protein
LFVTDDLVVFSPSLLPSTNHRYHYQYWPCSARDVVKIVNWRVLSNGAVVITFCSVPEPSSWTCVQKLLRAQVEYGGYRLTPAPDGHTRVQFVLKLDLNGSLPSFALENIARTHAHHVLALHTLKFRQDEKLGVSPSTNRKYAPETDELFEREYKLCARLHCRCPICLIRLMM